MNASKRIIFLLMFVFVSGGIVQTTRATEIKPASGTGTATCGGPVLKTADVTDNTGKKTLIRRVDAMTVVIVSQSGTTVVCDPATLPDGIEPDLFLVTHDHHLNKYLMDQYKDAKQVVQKLGRFTFKGVKVNGIAASHTEDSINKEMPDIVTYIFQVDGLRMAHFSCIGQTKFTREQLKALGKIDIAFLTTDEYPGFISVKKSCDLMAQLKPKVIIPLAHGLSDFNVAVEDMSKATGKEIETVYGTYAVSKSDLKKDGQKVIKLEKAK